MTLSEDQKLNLVVAVLAGYSYSVETAWGLKGKLQQAGFAKPETFVGKDVAAIGNMMKAAGYDRGGITYIIAPRVGALMEALANGQLKGLADAIKRGSERDFCHFLELVKGVGPKTAQIAWMLSKPI